MSSSSSVREALAQVSVNHINAFALLLLRQERWKFRGEIGAAAYKEWEANEKCAGEEKRNGNKEQSRSNSDRKPVTPWFKQRVSSFGCHTR